jgi:hypothetical protein
MIGDVKLKAATKQVAEPGGHWRARARRSPPRGLCAFSTVFTVGSARRVPLRRRRRPPLRPEARLDATIHAPAAQARNTRSAAVSTDQGEHQMNLMPTWIGVGRARRPLRGCSFACRYLWTPLHSLRICEAWMASTEMSRSVKEHNRYV